MYWQYILLCKCAALVYTSISIHLSSSAAASRRSSWSSCSPCAICSSARLFLLSSGNTSLSLSPRISNNALKLFLSPRIRSSGSLTAV